MLNNVVTVSTFIMCFKVKQFKMLFAWDIVVNFMVLFTNNNLNIIITAIQLHCTLMHIQ